VRDVPAGSERLRLVTWNVHHGVGMDGRLDLARIAGNLAALGPDVVGLQEVDRGFDARSDWRDQPDEIAEALGMHLLRGPALHRPAPSAGAPDGEYGVALLTRAPARLVKLLPLRLPGTEHRVVLHAEVSMAVGPMTVLVTHLDFGSAAVRRRQAERIASLDVAGPALLLADLNARPAAAELAPLRGWRDAWVEAPERSGGAWPFAGATVSAVPSRWASGHLVGRTQPARFPLRRVDAVLVRGEVQPLRAEVPRIGGSDHLPLVVDVELP
jgi:endonuclease/exonuclease/phosphatase family metal-dependent hydrolase